jgi:hypothetical protein
MKCWARATLPSPEASALPVLRAFLSTQVYKRLEGLQAAGSGPPSEPEAAGHSPPSPQENSYMSTTGSAQSGSGPCQPLAVPSGAPAQAAQQLQKSPNQPVESDESISSLSASLHSWHLTPGCPPRPAPLKEVDCTERGTAGESSWGSGPGLQPTAVEGSSGVQESTGDQRGGPEASFHNSPHISHAGLLRGRNMGPAVQLTMSLAWCYLTSLPKIMPQVDERQGAAFLALLSPPPYS